MNTTLATRTRQRTGAGSILTLMAALVGLAALVVAARFVREGVVGLPQSALPAAGETMTVLGLTILGAWLSGRIARRIGLPALTGQLIFGIAIGPELWSVLGRPTFALVNAEQLAGLATAEMLALVMIGLVAGSEIDASFLKPRLRSIAALGGFQIVAVSISVAAMASLLRYQLHEAALLATIAATSSSAVSVALLREMRHPTEFARLLLATTLSKDLLLVLAFSIVMFLVASTGTTRAFAPTWDAIAWRLVGSIAIGAALAWPLARAIGCVERRVGALVLVVAMGFVALCGALGLVPLVAAVTFGFTMRAIAPRETASFFANSRRMFLAVCCVFFAAAGAHLDLGGLAAHWPGVLALSATRSVSMWIGASLGARAGGLSPGAIRWAWAGFIPQAGMSLALVAQMSLEFPGEPWARSLSSVVIACIAIDELAGPIVMRMALKRVTVAVPGVP
ncbi:MAG: hypothetical protein EXS03_03675 [Phycisphaerales bacterium]|nr:hypothetical protein [Phycisphaerales bacterium]